MVLKGMVCVLIEQKGRIPSLDKVLLGDRRLLYSEQHTGPPNAVPHGLVANPV